MRPCHRSKTNWLINVKFLNVVARSSYTFSGVHISESLIIPLFSEGNLDTVLLPKIFNKYTDI